jgi:hypothetical protein
MRYCPFCGEPQQEGTRFCPKCGNQYPFEDETPVESTEPAAPTAGAAASPPPRRPRRTAAPWYRTIPFLLAGVVAAAALGYGLYRVGVGYLDARRPDPGVTTPVLAGSPTAPGGSPVAGGSPSPSPVVISPAAAVPALGRARVGNTEGQGANLRQRPSATAPVVKSVPEGTTVELIGPDQQADGRAWRNVRDPEGSTGWIAAELLTE